MKSAALLVVGSFVLWAAVLYPGWLLWGELALIQSAVAWLLCVAPGVATLLWAQGRNATPEMRTMAVLAGSGLRMFVTLSGGLLLTDLLPETFTKMFWLWVGVFYMLLLALEVVLLVRHHQRASSVG